MNQDTAENTAGCLPLHRRGSDYTRAYNFVTCSCGWRQATEYSGTGEWARMRWLEHVIETLMDEREATNNAS